MYDFNVGVFNDMLVRSGSSRRRSRGSRVPTLALSAIMLGAHLAGLPVFCRHDPGGTADDPVGTLRGGGDRWCEPDTDAVQDHAPSIADVIATAILLRTIWVANSLDVILVMTGGGPGYATHTLPLYAFVRAYSGMEFGYGAALARSLTLLLLAVVWLYVRRASQDLDR